MHGARSGGFFQNKSRCERTNKSKKVESEIQALRRRLSRLSAAVLCVNSSLDLDTVLHEIVASTRNLIGSRYGVIVTVDETGQPQEPVISGASPDEERALMVWPPVYCKRCNLQGVVTRQMCRMRPFMLSIQSFFPLPRPPQFQDVYP